MSGAHDLRPDGRAHTPETLKLREATRTLRLHLDKLPIAYDVDAPGDQILASLAFMSARHRYDCAESMIGAGFGGTVLGSIARSLFIDGLRWLWIGDHPERRRAPLRGLLDERHRLCELLEGPDASCGNLPRWLMPLPGVAGLIDHSKRWLDAQTMPDENELLADFLAQRPVDGRVNPSPSETDSGHAKLLRRGRILLDMSGLRGAAMVLAHAGHGNYLGLQSSLTDDGAIGHDLRADHEGLFMHVAATGVTATLLGTAAALPDSWPSEIEREPFLERAIELASDVAKTAVAIHQMDTRRRPVTKKKKQSTRPPRIDQLHSQAILAADDLLPDVNSADHVIAAFVDYQNLSKRMPINPWGCEQSGLNRSLYIALTYGGAHSNLQAVTSTYDKPGYAVIATFAARMMLEESARLLWRFSNGDAAVFEARAKQFFDEYRARKKKTINTLVGSGVPKAAAHRIFTIPGYVRVVTPADQIAVNRQPLPTISCMLREMGAPYPEPGWVGVAYSLLSQITHSTPLGLLHVNRFCGNAWHGNELSVEMLALTLDTACLGSAHLIGLSTVILTDMSDEALHFRKRLLWQAAVVHDKARLVHGLD